MPDAATRLHAIRNQVDRSARTAGRDPRDVTLIAVSKGRPAAAIEELIEAGQRDFGENRVAEAAAKWPALRARFPDVQLHMIGQLQSNKAKAASDLFDAIHSLDRTSLLASLSDAGWTGETFVQVNVGEEIQKGGVALEELGVFLGAVRAAPIRLCGLMAIPPAGLEPSPYFALLAKMARRHEVTGLSMGMSGDYGQAVMLGATHVRIGTALFED